MHASAPPITRYQREPPLLSCPGKVTHTGSPTHIGSQSLQCAAGQGQACQAASAPSAISSLRLCRHEPWIKPHVLFAPPCHTLLLSAPVTAWYCLAPGRRLRVSFDYHHSAQHITESEEPVIAQAQFGSEDGQVVWWPIPYKQAFPSSTVRFFGKAPLLSLEDKETVTAWRDNLAKVTSCVAHHVHRDSFAMVRMVGFS